MTGLQQVGAKRSLAQDTSMRTLPGEMEVYKKISSDGDLDHEIKMVRLQLRRCFKAQAEIERLKNGLSPDDLIRDAEVGGSNPLTPTR